MHCYANNAPRCSSQLVGNVPNNYYCLYVDQSQHKRLFVLYVIYFILLMSYIAVIIESTGLGYSKYLLRRYVVYIVGQLMLFLAIIITYDVLSSRYTLHSDGHCFFFNESSYTTLHIMEANTIVNKSVQITMFAVYTCKSISATSSQ